MKIEELVKVIQESRELFGENELAYLSLTSKNESVIRDRIAYKLHLELKNSIVAREHSIKAINSRIDLAVLENNDMWNWYINNISNLMLKVLIYEIITFIFII